MLDRACPKSPLSLSVPWQTTAWSMKSFIWCIPHLAVPNQFRFILTPVSVIFRGTNKLSTGMRLHLRLILACELLCVTCTFLPFLPSRVGPGLIAPTACLDAFQHAWKPLLQGRMLLRDGLEIALSASSSA